MEVDDRLRSLAETVIESGVGREPHDRFADVALVRVQPLSEAPGFYPEDRYFVTQHVEEVAWLFVQIRDIFVQLDGYGFWKEELFGRLANAGNFYLARNPSADPDELCLALILEAFEIFEDFVEHGGTLPAPLVTVDNVIADDRRDPLDGSRPAGQESVRTQLRQRGARL